jgi:membrane-associated PAP2 superfamily phosphatase
MNKSNISEMAVRKSRHFLFSWDLILPIVLLIAGTILFRSTNLDSIIQSSYYSQQLGWAFENSPIPKFIYHYGNIPALLLCIGALVVFVLGYSKAKLLPYRRIGLYLVLAMLIGPGIIVNSMLKDNWGRPRPRDTIQFGGDYAYEAPLTYDASSPGKSFPCGHATTGFYFFALAFVLRKKNKLWGLGCLLFAALWGTVIGWVRIGQGGHFASDVLWAGVIVYLSSYVLFRAMHLDRQLLFVPDAKKAPRKLKLYQKLALAVVGILIIIGVLLATPNNARKDVFISKVFTDKGDYGISLKLEKSHIKVSLGKESKFSLTAIGFGFPGSKLKNDSSFTDSSYVFSAKQKGYFTELNCNSAIQIDTLKVSWMSVTLADGLVDLLVPATFSDTVFVSNTTEVQSHPKQIVIIKQQLAPYKKLWFDTPILKVSTQGK